MSSQSQSQSHKTTSLNNSSVSFQSHDSMIVLNEPIHRINRTVSRYPMFRQQPNPNECSDMIEDMYNVYYEQEVCFHSLFI